MAGAAADVEGGGMAGVFRGGILRRLEVGMSGRRTKALRRELAAKLGRPALAAEWVDVARMSYGTHQRTSQPNSGLRRWVKKAAAHMKDAIGWFQPKSQKRASSVGAKSEFRFYKRHRMTLDEFRAKSLGVAA
jgi:hypothetical protein